MHGCVCLHEIVIAMAHNGRHSMFDTNLYGNYYRIFFVSVIKRYKAGLCFVIFIRIFTDWGVCISIMYRCGTGLFRSYGV